MVAAWLLFVLLCFCLFFLLGGWGRASVFDFFFGGREAICFVVAFLLFFVFRFVVAVAGCKIIEGRLRLLAFHTKR